MQSPLSDLVAELAARHAVPGAAVAVLRGGDVTVACEGVTSTADPLPITPETLFFWGSTSKTLTATALMVQVDRGVLRLDDLVRDHLPELVLSDASVLDVLTVRMLLNHTAGWQGDGEYHTGWGDDALRRAVTEGVSQQPQVLAPGEVVSYNNDALLLAGRLLEVVGKQEFTALVRETVLEPVGMSSTSYLPWEVTGRRLAQGHLDGAPVPGWPLTRASGPAGGLVGSLEDHVRWARYCLDGTTDGTRPIQEQTRLLMQQPTIGCRSGLAGVGVSWLLVDRGPVRLITHGGNVNNLQLSTFALAPDHGIGVIALTSGRGGGELGKVLLEAVLDDVAPRPEPLPPAQVDPDVVGSYEGGQWQQRITAEDGQLFVQMVLPDTVPEVTRKLFERPPAPIVPVGTDQFSTPDRPREAVGDVGRAADGSIAWLRWGLRAMPRATT